MTDERQSGVLFESWLKDTDPMPPDARPTVARVMARVPQTRQRGRWWPLPVFDRPAPIPATNGPTPARGFTMFSALKFVAAGVIVALFGGFLLAGVLTTQQGDEVLPAAVTASPEPVATAAPTEPGEPDVRTDILPGVTLIVEEVEPGVYRVVNDGVRDLANANNTDIVAGHDGGIWLLRPQRFYRLGTERDYGWSTKEPRYVSDFEVAPDGTVWSDHVRNPKREQSFVMSFDGEEWTSHHKTWGQPTLEVTPDGTVWASWQEAFGYLDEDGWQALGHLENGRSLHVASPDDIWGIGWVSNALSGYLYRFVDGAWQRWVTMEGTEPTWQPTEDPLAKDAEWFGSVAVGPDGTFWGIATFPNRPNLVRFDGSGWNRWPAMDTDTFWPTGSATMGGGTALGVAPDGSVWVALLTGSWGRSKTCDGGVGHFDGLTWDRYLSGLCVEAIDITADGTVWLLASEKEGRNEPLDIYVITPEAVAATE